ncbi:MAG: hypothetical protein ACREAC_29025, partial [Blastocatellia bacterium]
THSKSLISLLSISDNSISNVRARRKRMESKPYSGENGFSNAGRSDLTIASGGETGWTCYIF